MESCEGRLSKVFGCVVPGDERLKIRVLDSSDPGEIGKVFNAGSADFGLFLVTEGGHDISNVQMYTGGFYGPDGESLTELNRATKQLGALKRGETLFIEELDYGMLDFVLWYHFDLVFSDGLLRKAWFQFKGYWLTPENYRYVQALSARGHCFTLKELSSSVGSA